MRGAEPPTGAGLAACLALLELEARALGRPLVALLIAAAGEALRDPPEPAKAPPDAERVSARAFPRLG